MLLSPSGWPSGLGSGGLTALRQQEDQAHQLFLVVLGAAAAKAAAAPARARCCRCRCCRSRGGCIQGQPVSSVLRLPWLYLSRLAEVLHGLQMPQRQSRSDRGGERRAKRLHLLRGHDGHQRQRHRAQQRMPQAKERGGPRGVRVVTAGKNNN